MYYQKFPKTYLQGSTHANENAKRQFIYGVHEHFTFTRIGPSYT